MKNDDRGGIGQRFPGAASSFSSRWVLPRGVFRWDKTVSFLLLDGCARPGRSVDRGAMIVGRNEHGLAPSLLLLTTDYSEAWVQISGAECNSAPTRTSDRPSALLTMSEGRILDRRSRMVASPSVLLTINSLLP